MKKIIFLLVLLNSHYLVSQTEEDYKSVLKNTVEAMNSQDGRTLFDQFSEDLQSSLSLEQLDELIHQKVEELGLLSEYDFMDEDEGGRRYLVQTDNDSFILILKLSPEMKLTEFRIE